ncbi:hypothetical protein N7491_000916 [Penicillium cf. griseofulvum]|uniref:MINDY deubiquitinase domain-containing protein n=1 Tax=Penicillium cf. griseofulvum TaxID=2972120 RepID=A0A9W9ILT5_9EURO|nr:hypothetical protein N7472_011324 [Penicillium cf. griseofulvum]KAJ5443078.1 hypothetical protein N7445_004829 [Penicillium cf. griseofulvum]KAJ5451734.1 hypothetical protein N7491_000916 [Penicillium cf. griseofulvum]
MGLRKQPPPRLENISKSNPRSDARSPKSPNSASSHRPIRLNRFPSEDSIYSPDLNTSPAFDLMPLQEAQRSPMGSPTNQPPNSWPNNNGTPDDGRSGQCNQYESAYREPENINGHWVPPTLITGQQQGEAENVWRSTPDAGHATAGELPVQLQSNNPFLKPRSAERTQDLLECNEWGRDSHGTSNSDSLSLTEGYIPMTARLSLLDEPKQESPWADAPRPHSNSEKRAVLGSQQLDDNSPWGSQQSIKVSAPPEIYLQGMQSNPYAPAVSVKPSDPSDADDHSHAQFISPYSAGRLGSDTGIYTPPVTLSGGTSATSRELSDLVVLGAIGKSEVETGSHAASSLYSEPAVNGARSSSDKQELASSIVQQPQQSQTTPILSAAEAAKQKEQRSETYTIRHIRWTDQSGQLLESPVLVQNQNGPCPLLALINALILRANPNTHPPIVRALSTREQISLGLLIEAMFEELTICLGPDEEFPDIEALAQFLTMLHTGMNVNPRLIMDSTEGFGTFLETSDLRLYGTFGVPLIHAWLAPWSSPTHAAMSRTAQYYEDIQMLPFRRQEFEDRVARGDTLQPEEENTMADIQTIQRFVEIENPTQLSPFGLTQLSTKLAPGSVSILFRNDHFSTLYKHPQSHQLYTLVTDAGYAGHAEVVWESLVDVTGFNTEYYSGDFRPVGAGPSTPSGPGPASRAPNEPTQPPNANEVSKSPEPTQEQSDADYAYALSLQFQEEEQRENARNEQARDHHTSAPSNSFNRPSPSPRLSNVPARSSSVANVGSQPRPPQHGPDPEDLNAPPPPYEQATGGPRYSPPDRRSYGGTPSNPPVNQYPGNRNSRNRNQYSHRPRPVGAGVMETEKNRDCIVM